MVKRKNLLSLVLAISMIFSLLTTNMMTVFANGRSATVNVNEETAKLEVFVTAPNADEVYFVGSLTGWGQNENWKLTETDVAGIFEANFDLTSVPQGNHQYKFNIVTDGITDWMTNDGQNNADEVFYWDGFVVEGTQTALRISSNEIVIGEQLEYVVVDTSTEFSLVETPEITAKDDALTITDTHITVADTANIGDKFSFTVSLNGETYTKELTVVSPSEGTKVHFYKTDNNYDTWKVWNWADGGQGSDIYFSSEGDMGAYGYIELPNFLFKRGEWAEQTPDQRVPEGSTNVYVIKDDTTVYTTLKDATLATAPRFVSAIMDSEDQIVASLTERPADDVNFILSINGVVQDDITYTVDKTKVIFDTTDLDFVGTDSLEIYADKTFVKPLEVTKRAVLDKFAYEGDDLGVTYIAETITVKLWAPTANKVELLTYTDGQADKENPSNAFDMTFEPEIGLHSVIIDKEENYNKYYMFRLTFGETAEKVTYAVDPYAVSTAANGVKGALIDINDPALFPAGWEEDVKPEMLNPEDHIIYEMHVRDFTIDENWGGTDEYAGKFLGLAENGTTYTDPQTGVTVSTGLDHLVELGITTVHLLPVYDFASNDELGDDSFGAIRESNGEPNRNWGYDPQNYNVPEGSYSTDASDPAARIIEFREMVLALHKNGIRVVNDMVYNHMATTHNMESIVPGYYFRTLDNLTFSNGSGCGNEMASEREMVRKFMVESNVFWVENYHIDGMRFDLMALIDTETMAQIEEETQAIEPTTLLYGEPWKASSSTLDPDLETIKNRGIAAFNDSFRNALRGDNNPSKGFINGGITEETSAKVISGLEGSIDEGFLDPADTINYAEAHDNYAIWDQVEKAQFGTENGEYRQNIPENALEDERVRQAILGNAMVFTAQGIPFYQEGSEILRTKQGDHNSYKSDDETNDIDWADKVDFIEVFEYYSDIINLRKDHPAFRMTTAEDIANHQEVYTLNDNDGIIIQHLKDNANGDVWKNIVVVYNATTENQAITWLPEATNGVWNIVADGDGVYNDNFEQIAQTENAVSYELKAASMLVLFDEEISSQTRPRPETDDTNDDVEIEDGDTALSDGGILNFDDVANHWAFDSITYVFEANIMNGVSDSKFAPNENATRAMVWTVLARMNGIETEGGENWYAKALDWAIQNEISDGTNPMDEITREDLVTMIYRLAEEETNTTETVLGGFTDVNDVSEYAVSAMEWAVSNGIITGKTETTLNPKDLVTRAELSAIIQRYLETE